MKCASVNKRNNQGFPSVSVPVQETRAPSLVQGDPTRLSATKPAPHGHRARGHRGPQGPPPALRKRSSHENPCRANGEEPAQQRRPSRDKSHEQTQSVFKKQTATTRFSSGLGDQEQGLHAVNPAGKAAQPPPGPGAAGR